MPGTVLDHAGNGLVIFCGAGVSMVPPACLPSWWQMNEQVVQALARQIEPICGQERAADWVRQINARRDSRHFPPEFQAEIISRHYGAAYFRVLECLDGDEPNAVHLAIAALARSGQVRAIVTSNFDRLLEIAFRKLDVPLDVHFEAAHFEKLARDLEESSSRQSRCQLLKLHGSVDDHRTLVDTLAQRMRGFSPAISDCLRLLLRRHYWLFLGYSGGDLEGNPQYLCLRSEADRAAGFCWLVRESAKDEPIEAVVKICALYGDRASAPRGELPAWFLEQFGSLVPENLRSPSVYSNEELDRRKQAAERAISEHTREWSATLGGVRAAVILADMLEQSVSNPQAARELLTVVLDTTGQDPRVYVAVANSLANVLARAGSLDDAMKLAEKALAKTGPGDEEARAGILGTMGFIEQNLGNHLRALEHFEKAYESNARSSHEDRMSIMLHNRAMTLSSLGRNDEAMSCYEESLAIVRKLGDAIAQAQTLNNIGDLLRRQDRYDEAIDALNRAIALRERLGDDRGVANCLGNIAAAHQRQGRFAEAHPAYDRILAIFRRIEDRSGEVTTMFNLGKLAEEQGRMDEAESIYRQAMAIATECGMEPQRAEGLAKLASNYRVAGRSAEARPLFDEALAIHRRHGDKSKEADVLNDFGIFLQEAGELDPAMSAFNQAIAIREQLKEEAGLCEAMGNLALAFMNKGELGQAMALLSRKLGIAQRLNAKRLIANAHYNIGVVHHRQEAVEDALESLEVAQRLYREMGSTGQAIDILAIMGEICGRQGRIGASLGWFDQAIPLAVEVAQRTKIASRLTHVFEVLLENGYEELGQQYVQRLEAVGARVQIENT